MTIDSLRDLKAVIMLCRKQGITSIKIDNIEMQIAPMPENRRQIKDFDLELPPEAKLQVPLYEAPTDKVSTESFDSLTDEEKLFWSARSEVPS